MTRKCLFKTREIGHSLCCISNPTKYNISYRGSKSISLFQPQCPSIVKFKVPSTTYRRTLYIVSFSIVINLKLRLYRMWLVIFAFT